MSSGTSTSSSTFLLPRNDYQSLNQNSQMGIPSAADAGPWQLETMAGSMNTLSDFSDLSLRSGIARVSPNALQGSRSTTDVPSQGPMPRKRRSPHGSTTLSQNNHNHKRPNKGKASSQWPNTQSTGDSSPEKGLENKPAKSGQIEPQTAIVLLEASVQTFSTFSKNKAAALISQFKQVIQEEKLYGNTTDDSSDMIFTSTASSSRDSVFVSEASDSEYRTDDTSVSSTPRQPIQNAQDDMTTDAKPIHAPCIQCGIKPIYYCTRDNCDYSSHQFSEWKRHEEGEKHWPQERFMCLSCPTPVSDTTGNPACQFCKVSFLQLAGSARTHYLQCAPAKAEGKTFGRDHRLAEHLQKDHPEGLQTDHSMSSAMPLAVSSSYPVNSNWPRQCGFCGQRFQDWAQRMKHVGKHFQDGKHISFWTLPFPRPKGIQPKGPDVQPKDDDSDDDDFDGDNGRSHDRATPKQNTTTSVSSGQARSGRSSGSQMNGFRSQQGYRERTGTDDPLADDERDKTQSFSRVSKFNRKRRYRRRRKLSGADGHEAASESEIHPNTTMDDRQQIQDKGSLPERRSLQSRPSLALERYIRDPEEPGPNLLGLPISSDQDDVHDPKPQPEDKTEGNLVIHPQDSGFDRASLASCPREPGCDTSIIKAMTNPSFLNSGHVHRSRRSSLLRQGKGCTESLQGSDPWRRHEELNHGDTISKEMFDSARKDYKHPVRQAKAVSDRSLRLHHAGPEPNFQSSHYNRLGLPEIVSLGGRDTPTINYHVISVSGIVPFEIPWITRADLDGVFEETIATLLRGLGSILQAKFPASLRSDDHFDQVICNVGLARGYMHLLCSTIEAGAVLELVQGGIQFQQRRQGHNLSERLKHVLLWRLHELFDETLKSIHSKRPKK
jgi:hypothetical protein